MQLKFKNVFKNHKGFSLVELMVVVAIIAILAGLAIPKFRSFQAKARQTEAKSNLTHIYTLEESYHGDHDKYADLAPHGNLGGGSHTCADNELGFKLDPCEKARYKYYVADASSVQFRAIAESGAGAENQIMPNCRIDQWSIDQDKNLYAAQDSVTQCN